MVSNLTYSSGLDPDSALHPKEVYDTATTVDSHYPYAFRPRFRSRIPSYPPRFGPQGP